MHGIESVRHTKQTGIQISSGQKFHFALQPRGTRLAAQTPASLYLPDLMAREYVWRGRENPLAARLKDKLIELGIS